MFSVLEYEGKIGFAGGGRSNSDTGGASDSSWSSDSSWENSYRYNSSGHESLPIALPLLIITILIVICFLLWKLSKKKKHLDINSISQQADNAINVLSTMDNDETPQEKWVHAEAEKIFMQYQKDWSNFNTQNIKSYTTNEYANKASLMLETIKRADRQNIVGDLKVIRVTLPFSITDRDKLPINVKTIITFSGVDEIVDLKTQEKLFEDHYYGLKELWEFVYDGKTLKLNDIRQPTESEPHKITNIADFAKRHEMTYCLDWGRYVLPTKGLIFNGVNLALADINNYMVGKWGDCIVQMYTYSKTPADAQSYYIVGQINVPKRYQGVIIKPREVGIVNPPANYNEVKTEWEEFNKRYCVYAEKQDALVAFELLNPSFLDNLYDRELNYSIEVVDNVIYIFSKVNNADETDYDDLFEVLSAAYKELKM